MTGGSLKPWQIVLFVAAVGALGWSVWSTLSKDRIDQLDEVLMVDVNSGELFLVDVSNAVVLPEAHPDTGAYSLLPVQQEGDDSPMKISGRYLPLLSGIDGGHGAVDRRTGVVTASEGTPRRLD